MKFIAEAEGWNTYRLDDGTEVMVRTILVSVRRRDDQFTDAGDPMYDLNMQNIVHVEPPEHLRRQMPPMPITKQ